MCLFSEVIALEESGRVGSDEPITSARGQQLKQVVAGASNVLDDVLVVEMMRRLTGRGGGNR